MTNLVIYLIIGAWILATLLVIWIPFMKENKAHKKQFLSQPSEDYNDRAIQHYLFRVEAQKMREEEAEEAEEKEYIEYQSFCRLLNLTPSALKSIALFNRVREKAHKFYEEEIER